MSYCNDCPPDQIYAIKLVCLNPSCRHQIILGDVNGRGEYKGHCPNCTKNVWAIIRTYRFRCFDDFSYQQALVESDNKILDDQREKERLKQPSLF